MLRSFLGRFGTLISCFLLLLLDEPLLFETSKTLSSTFIWLKFAVLFACTIYLLGVSASQGTIFPAIWLEFLATISSVRGALVLSTRSSLVEF